MKLSEEITKLANKISQTNMDKFIEKNLELIKPKDNEIKDVKNVLKSIWISPNTIIVPKKIKKYYNKLYDIAQKEKCDSSFIIS